ncbi:MAG: hypothetical protein HYX34_10810 [Actinobacteria bacterium]|nr:hypothetical protein [Actinomycetota bacterium]
MAVGVVAATAACSSGSSGGPKVATTTTTPVRPGTGTFTMSGRRLDLRVRMCTTDPGPATDPTATREFLLEATGADSGTTYTVRVTRFRSNTGQGGTTFTETADLLSGSGSDVKGLEARRSSSKGRWIDLLDRAARRPLIDRRGDRVRVSGRFGPQGVSEGDRGIYPAVLDARCP